MTELHDLSLIEKAMRADSQRPLNEPKAAEVPQGLREYHECLRALREQLERRVQAAGGQ